MAGHVWAEIRGADGSALNDAPLPVVLELVYRLELDRVGTFTARIPATKAAIDTVTAGRQLWFRVDGEGVVFKGIVEQVAMRRSGEQRVLEVAGGSIAKQLVWKTTLLGRKFDSVTLSSAVSTLLSDTGWSAGTMASPTTTLTARMDGVSIWGALAHVAEQFGLHLREDHLSAGGPFIDIDSFGGAPKLIAANVPEVTAELSGDNAGVVVLTDVTERVEALDLANRIIPLGQQTGVANATPWLTLQYSTRTSPYAIQSATGPDGKTYYYIRDAASEAAYGVREYVLQVRDIAPLSTSTTDRERAANALYDAAVSYLQRHKAPVVQYSLGIAGLTHCAGGVPRFEAGDTVRLVYRGVVRDETGAETVKAIDRSDLYIVAAERRMSASEDSWLLTVSNVPRQLPDDGNVTEQFVEQLRATRTAPLPYVLFGDNTMRISERGYELRVPPDSGMTGSTERKLRWFTDADFTNLVGELFIAYHSTLAASFATLWIRSATDSILTLGVRDAVSGSWRQRLEISNNGVNPYQFQFSGLKGTSYDWLAALDYYSGNTKFFGWRNGNWVDLLEGAMIVDIQVFNASGTWSKPSAARLVQVICIGGGGGAGGGSSSIPHASGGGGGGRAEVMIPASSLPSTVTVTIGAGGAGGTGAGGANGGDSTFGAFCTGYGGRGGSLAAGSNTASGGSGGGPVTKSDSTVQLGNIAGATSGNHAGDGGGGGGSAGGITSSGNAGGYSARGGGGGGGGSTSSRGVGGSTIAATGGIDANGGASTVPGVGGGGGSGRVNGNGYAGGAPGGGGGGGTSTSGGSSTGGSGANGQVVVICYA